MSAISLATIITEAGKTSGSLIQATAALEQNRKVFILQTVFLIQNLRGTIGVIGTPINYQECKQLDIQISQLGTKTSKA